jgi:hypothetical protein
VKPRTVKLLFPNPSGCTPAVYSSASSRLKAAMSCMNSDVTTLIDIGRSISGTLMRVALMALEA